MEVYKLAIQRAFLYLLDFAGHPWTPLKTRHGLGYRGGGYGFRHRASPARRKARHHDPPEICGLDTRKQGHWWDTQKQKTAKNGRFL